MAKKIDSNPTIDIMKFTRETATFCVLGIAPLFMERMSEKVKGGLLSPAPKKNASEKASTLKHDPLQEYRDSAYTSMLEGNPTRLQLLSTAFKRAMATAALEIPGAKKAQIGRLTYVPGQYVDVYGLPKMSMAVVRSSDMNRTPDIRTRLVVPEWAALLSVSYVTPQLNHQSIGNLLVAAGDFIGVGGWRPEKGSGAFGRFMLVEEDHKDFVRITKIGRTQQDKALLMPDFFDKETQDLYEWYLADSRRRGFHDADDVEKIPAIAARKSKRNGHGLHGEA
jgi:hypothetical protein